MLIAIPSNDKQYFRGMGLGRFLGRALGDDSSGVDWSTVDLSGNSLPPVSPTFTPIQATAPAININYGTSALTAPLPTIAPPANTVLAANGQAVPKAGYTVNAQGQVVAMSSLSGLSASLASIPTSYWLIGILALTLAAAGSKKGRR